MKKIVNGKEVELTPEEEKAVLAEWEANALKARAARSSDEKRQRFKALREELLTARAAGETPDSLKVEEFKRLREIVSSLDQ